MSLQVWLPLTKDLRNQGLVNSAVTNSGATYSSSGGKLGGCYVFDGTDDAIGVGNLSTLTTSDFTFACWFYHDDTWSSKGWETIFGGPSGFELQTKNSTTNSPCIYLYSWGKGNFVYDLNKWHHLAMTRTSSEVNVYLNGELKITGSAGSIPSGDYFIGSWKNSASQNFKGKVCDVRIYNDCLSADEIKELSRGLVCHYTFGDKYLESTVNWLSDRGMSSYGSYGFGSQGTITTTTEIAPPIARKEVGLITSKRTTTVNDAVEIATSMGSSAMNQGDTFTVSAYVKGKGNTVGKRCHIHLYNTNGTNTQSTGKDYTFTNEWQRIDYTLTWNNATPSNNSLNCYVVGYIAGGEQFYVSCIQVEHKNHSTPFVGTERTTTTVYDSSGFANNGTISGDLTINSVKPKYGSCIYIPAAATISHDRCLDNTNQEWTCIAWVKPDIAGNYQNLNNFNSNNRLYHGTYPLLYLNSGSNDYYRYGNKAIPAGEWTHVAFVFKNSTGQRDVYLNGVLQNGSGPNLTSTPSGIPATVVLAGGNYAGYLSDYREYATALSQSDIVSLYQNEAAFDEQGNILGPIR